jgi:hypothetical protein
MPTPTPLAHGFSSIIHAWMAELAPKVQLSFHDIEQWDRDTLVRRYCIVSAELRDTSIRIVEGFPDPPANADLMWWRNNVASPADSWCLCLWKDQERLPLVLEETGDPFAVHMLIGLLIGFFYVCREIDRRLEAQKVSHLARRMFDDAIVNSPAAQHKAFQTLCNLTSKQKDKNKDEESHALVGVFHFFERERAMGPMDSQDYGVLGLGPLQVSHPTKVEGWDIVAGQLLAEDIQRMDDQYRPLLVPDLDDKAIGSALDTERKRYRESLALQRGGRGTGKWTTAWKCCDQILEKDVRRCPRCDRKCPGIALTAWKCCNQLIEQDVAICPSCSQARPNTVLHISIDTDGKKNSDTRIGPLKAVLFSESLSNVAKHVPQPVRSAFERIAEGATDEEAARAEGISARTIRRWRDKLRPSNPFSSD